TRSGRAVSLAAGSLIYLAYVLWVGGDFMSGRFISAPVFLALAAVAVAGPKLRRWQLGMALVAVVAVGAYPITSPLRAGDDYGVVAKVKARDGVEDERRFYHRCASLALATDEGWPACVHAREGRRDRDRGEAVLVKGSVGYYGFFAGPDKHVVDRFALVDPLLARLPMERYKWRIGHFRRQVPPGYLETLRSGENEIADEDLAAFYDRLALVVRGDVLSAERFAAIWQLNTGALAHLVHEERYR
ncbi:MAG: hypothetical protein JRI55_15795, partial [Deltaproteobacteria bacterium]|nr:hypothetical protein [Deltaproteobacteria bacterium]